MADSEDGEFSLSCPHLPPELWSMVIKWMLVDQHPRQLQSLARVSRAFYQEINPLIYRSVWLKTHDENPLFTRTLRERPDLGAMIRVLRHDDDHGSKIYESDSTELYEELKDLSNIETVFMRLREESCKVDLDPVSPTGVHPFVRLGFQHADSSQLIPVDPIPKFPDGITMASSLWCPYLISPSMNSGFPALRSCHIGSDYWSNRAQSGDVVFPQTLFWHPTLEEICITNGSLFKISSDLGTTYAKPAPYSTALKEVKFLNTRINPADMHRILEYPKALKKLTYRGSEPILQDAWPQMEGEIPMDSYQEAILPQKDNLETIDLDLYWSELDWEDLTPFKALKHLIITPYVLTGPDTPDSLLFEEIELPTTIETLTFRYEKGETGLQINAIQEKIKAKKLPNLKAFTIEIPEHLDMRKGANICIDQIQYVVTWKRAFKDLGVKFEVPTVPYPKRMPSYGNCSCERMEYYHRFLGHTPDYYPDSDAEDYSPMMVDDQYDDDFDLTSDFDEDEDGNGREVLIEPGPRHLFDMLISPGLPGYEHQHPESSSDSEESEM